MDTQFSPPLGLQQEDPALAVLRRDVASLKTKLQEIEQISTLNRVMLTSPRVRIQNLEGVFKVVAVVPSNSDDYQDGSILLYDDGSSTRRIYAKMNKTWRFVALT